MKMLSNLGQQCSGSDRTSYTLTAAKHRKLWVVWLYKTRGVPLSNLNLWRKTAGAEKQIPAFLRIYLFLNDVAQGIWQRENVGWDLWWPGSSQKQRQLVYFEDGINEIERINYCILKITFPAAHPRFQHLSWNSNLGWNGYISTKTLVGVWSILEMLCLDGFVIHWDWVY